MELVGATCLVTGASGGIGRALVAELARRGAGRVLASVRDLSGFEPIEGVEPVVLDLSSRSTIDSGARELSGVDVLVNNAGRWVGGALEDQDLDAVYDMAHVNLVAAMHLTRVLLPGMIGRGRGVVVNNASISGYVWLPGSTTYAATKAGLIAFSEALRRELHGTGVQVLHLVTPGVTTAMLETTKADYDRFGGLENWHEQTPEQWASKVVGAIESGDSVLGPGGVLAVAKLASRGPGLLIDLAARRMLRRPAGH